MFDSYFHSEFSDTNDDMSLPHLTEQLITSLSTIKFTEYDVINVLEQLDINKGTTPNNIPLLILHNYAKVLAPSLTVLFNRSLSVGKIHSVWKHAYIVPIHKKDSKEMVEKYRPISLNHVLVMFNMDLFTKGQGKSPWHVWRGWCDAWSKRANRCDISWF